MDRHHNDKHSAAPPLYECHFKPCPYRSKRESNCKQHMEKAHGWTYVRSKNNGKNRDKAASNGLPTPMDSNIRTPSSIGGSEPTHDEENWEIQDPYTSDGYGNNDLIFPAYDPNLDHGMFPGNQIQIDYSPVSDHTGSSHSPFTANTLPGQENFPSNFENFENNRTDFSLFGDDDLYNAHAQLPTPSPHIYQRAVGGFETSGVPFAAEPVPHISPVGHGNAMLFTPNSMQELDEGFDEFMDSNCQMGAADFQLFPSSNSGTVASSAPSALFGEMPSATNINYPGVSAQELLDFYTANVTAATAGHHSSGMDWSADEQFTHYER
jgi:hypothetical protein